MNSAVWNLWVVLLSILLYLLCINNFVCQVNKHTGIHSLQDQNPIISHQNITHFCSCDLNEDDPHRLRYLNAWFTLV